jgi:hypothetical protein
MAQDCELCLLPGRKDDRIQTERADAALPEHAPLDQPFAAVAFAHPLRSVA